MFAGPGERSELVHRAEDRGLFRPPSLRNVALTAPYMHDGSLATLRDVLEHYAAGGRLAGRMEGTLARWSATARRWATERAALALYVVDVTSDLAGRLSDESA